MPLIIEDGTAKDDSNSFVTVEEAREYAEARGVELAPEDAAGDLAIERMLIVAGDYLNAQESLYSGQRVKPLEQAMCYPRINSTVYGNLIVETIIPITLKKAQMQLCIEQKNGVVLFPSYAAGASGVIIREKVGPLETEYASGSGMTISLDAPAMSAVAALLKPLYGQAFGLRTLRI